MGRDSLLDNGPGVILAPASMLVVGDSSLRCREGRGEGMKIHD
jgi:hypothetical protein